MKIITWNINGAQNDSAVWDVLLNFHPDIVLLQEVGAFPAQLADTFDIVSRPAIYKTGKPQRFSTAVLVRGKVLGEVALLSEVGWVNHELEFFKGNLISCRVQPKDHQPMIAISVYSPAWPVGRERLKEVDVSQVKTKVNPDVWVTDIVLTNDEFRLLLARFTGMYRVMVMLAACVGLRRSEIFGLKWSDCNWLLREIFVQRSHVEGYEDETKTESCNARVPLHPVIVEALLAWRHESAYNADTDYVFASPTMMGKKPLNSNSVQRDYLRPESIKAGLTPLGWHALRHSYRTWLGEKGTGPEVQRDLMRHSTIAMSLDGYGRGVPEANRAANATVVSDLLQ
jgi:hypothetical protein